MTATDAEVIAQSRGDPEAFAEIFDRHFELIFAYCDRRVSDGRSEDMAGEVFYRAFATRENYDLHRPDSLPWLIGIASHLVVDHLRAARLETAAYQRLVMAGVPEQELDSQVGTVIDAHRELGTVIEWLSRLPPGEAETLLLFVWEELSYQEISASLGIPVGTVRSRINRARRRLRRLRAKNWSGSAHDRILREGLP
jgi:RNA polymerase sigma-70 factor (ECF subfamily)